MLNKWVWDLKETKQIKDLVNKIIIFLKKELGDDLISLYVAGTILSNERKSDSDIDFFSVVKTNFDFKKEERLNKFFKEEKTNFCEGKDIEYYSVTIGELGGGEPKGRLTNGYIFKVPIGVVVKQYSKYKWVHGEKLDFSKFPTSGIKLNEELHYWLKFAEINIKKFELRKKYSFNDFLKSVMRLCNVDAQLNYGYKFDPSFQKLAKHLEKEEDHMMHLCYELRKKESITPEEKHDFYEKSKEYVSDLRKKIDKLG